MTITDKRDPRRWR